MAQFNDVALPDLGDTTQPLLEPQRNVEPPRISEREAKAGIDAIAEHALRLRLEHEALLQWEHRHPFYTILLNWPLVGPGLRVRRQRYVNRVLPLMRARRSENRATEDQAAHIVRARWAADGACVSCGWHAPLEEYGSLEHAMNVKESIGVIHLRCLAVDGKHHLGVRIRISRSTR